MPEWVKLGVLLDLGAPEQARQQDAPAPAWPRVAQHEGG
jgi:hypothetical protein